MNAACGVYECGENNKIIMFSRVHKNTANVPGRNVEKWNGKWEYERFSFTTMSTSSEGMDVVSDHIH